MNKLTQKTIVVLAVSLASVTAVDAQSGTPEDQRACAPSVKQFCVQAIQYGEFEVLACLQRNRARIAPSCQQVLIKYGQ